MDESIWTHEELIGLADQLLSSQEGLRAALARELHSELGSFLTGLSVDLSQIQMTAQQQGENLPVVIESARELLQKAIVLKRSFIERLFPSTLTLLGLGAALEHLSADFAARFNWDATVRISEAASLIAGPVAIDLYRLAETLLEKVASHATASAVQVSLLPIDGQLVLTIRDNGCGLLPTISSGDHNLRLMNYRVNRWKGRLKIETVPSKGTTVIASIPWPVSPTGHDPDRL